MDAQSLRLFVLACVTLSISAAGHALGMAPAVASVRIAKLEHLVGADLLHRRPDRQTGGVGGFCTLIEAMGKVARQGTHLGQARQCQAQGSICQ